MPRAWIGHIEAGADLRALCCALEDTACLTRSSASDGVILGKLSNFAGPEFSHQKEEELELMGFHESLSMTISKRGKVTLVLLPRKLGKSLGTLHRMGTSAVTFVVFCPPWSEEDTSSGEISICMCCSILAHRGDSDV